MISLILGIAAFVLFFLYDINSITRQYSLPHCFFAVGTVLLAAATILDLVTGWQAGAFAGALDYVLLAGGALCFGGLIYCLFFALPFKETYAAPSTGRRVYSGGVYALCRHPGILCFFAMELLLGLAALPEKMLLRGMIFSLLNLAYAYFQDRISFPRTFCDYTDYQKRVPFLIPNGSSIRRIGRTLPHAGKEEVEV